LLQSWRPNELPTHLVDMTVSDFIKAHAEGRGEPVFAAIDQVDDLLADPGPRWASRRKFLRDLANAAQAEPRLRLLLIARDEAADLITAELESVARYNLPALSRQGAIEAVRGPTAGTGRSFTDGSAEKLVSDLQNRRIVGLDGKERHVASDSIEPSLIQVVCTYLWASLPADTAHITPRDIRVFADADKALAEYCGQVIASVADDHDLSVTRLRSWVLDTFITEQGMQGTAYEGPVTTAGMPSTVARALEDRHLLVAEQRSGSRWYELLAARLIDPLLRSGEQLPSAEHAPDYLLAAERALARGEVAAADRYAHAALRSSSDADLRRRAEIETLLGNIAIAREEPAEAESHYRFAVRLFGALRDDTAVAAQLAAVGQTLVAQGELDAAIDSLQAAKDRVPGDPVIQTACAVALWRLGESRAAVAILNDVLEVDGGNSVALRARGEILAESGDPRKAISDLNRVTLEEGPFTRAARGLALARLGDQLGASTYADDAVTEAPHNGTVLLYAARVKSLGGRDEAAERLARRAVDATDPILPPYHREAALQLAGRKHGNHLRKLLRK
jgi:tetratricopeptide (TPR) repeat protein